MYICMYICLYICLYICVLLQDPDKRFGASLGALSAGRVGITSIGSSMLRLSVPIGIRYVCICSLIHSLIII